ncbi:MAG TPA: S8 family serine peptidase, partial [Rhodanobacteraceae bacterium]|nr:S8 family serine peptidase [Rhodanobacteraceae bacterium]
MTTPLGTFEPGSYDVTVQLDYDDFFGQPQTLIMGDASFVVIGAISAPIAAPASNPVSEALLVLLLLSLALFAIGRRKYGTVCMLVIAPYCHCSGAQIEPNMTVQFLVKNFPGAPTPAQVVSYYSVTPHVGPPPLHAFAIVSPLTMQYLLPVRAAGDFLAWLKANPNSARAQLENYTVGTFASTADAANAVAALNADPYVSVAYIPLPIMTSSVDLLGFDIDPSPALGLTDQYGRDELNIDAAWQLAGGDALIAQVDTGLYVSHPSLMQFSGSTFVGGNFIPAASLDIGLTILQPGQDSPIVDELRPEPVPAGPCTPVPANLSPDIAGHGTHVAGLIGANGSANSNVKGTCEHCGIAMWRVDYSLCLQSGEVTSGFNSNASDRGEAQAVDAGAQIMNLSFGAPASTASLTYCISHPTYASCLDLAYASSRDVIVVAAAGNNRTDLQFPASDPRVISAGGIEDQSAYPLWDEYPSCP